MESVGEKEIQDEVLIDGLFVNTPRVVFNEWFEKCFMSNEESESLPIDFKNKCCSTIQTLSALWAFLDKLKFHYLGFRKFATGGITQQLWEFRLYDCDDSENDRLIIFYRYQGQTNAWDPTSLDAWDPTSLYFAGSFTHTLKFLMNCMKTYRRPLKEELLPVTYHPDRLLWVTEHDFKPCLILILINFYKINFYLHTCYLFLIYAQLYKHETNF